MTRTVEHDLPNEIDYLRRHDAAIRRIMDAVEMPDRLAENLVMVIRQNRGTLPKNRRSSEYGQLRDDEVTLLEDIVLDAFEGFGSDADRSSSCQRHDPRTGNRILMVVPASPDPDETNVPPS